MKLYLPDGDGGYKEVELEGETCVINIENIIEDQTPPYELPTMSQTLKGGAAVGIGLYMTGNTLNATPYVLPTMNESVRGGAKVGDGLYMTGDQLNLLTMSENAKGGAKVGGGLYMVNDQLNLQTMSENIKGGAKVGEGLYMTGDTLNAKQLKFGDGFDTVDDVIEFDPLKKIPLGDGLHLDDDGNLAADTVAPFPPLGNGLKLKDNVLEVDPFDFLPTLGNGFSIDDGGLNFDPLEVMPLGEGLTLSPGGALAVDPAIMPSAGDTVVVKNPYVLPTMSESVKGGAKVGIGLYMTGDTLNANVTTIAQEAASFVSVSSSESSEEYHGLTLSVQHVETEEERDDLVDANREVCYRVPGKDSGGLSDFHYWGMPTDNAVYLENGSGELILPEEYMNIDFRILNIDDKEINVTGMLYDKDDINYDAYENAASRKTLRNGRTCVWLINGIMNQLVEDKIKIEWGFHSEKGNVNFKGTYIDLPRNPVHGWLVYSANQFYIYDETVKDWRLF